MEEHSPCVQITSNCSAFCCFVAVALCLALQGKGKFPSHPPPPTRSRRGTERQGIWMQLCSAAGEPWRFSRKQAQKITAK